MSRTKRAIAPVILLLIAGSGVLGLGAAPATAANTNMVQNPSTPDQGPKVLVEVSNTTALPLTTSIEYTVPKNMWGLAPQRGATLAPGGTDAWSLLASPHAGVSYGTVGYRIGHEGETAFFFTSTVSDAITCRVVRPGGSTSSTYGCEITSTLDTGMTRIEGTVKPLL